MNKDRVGALIFLAISVAYGLLAFKIPLTFIAKEESFNARTLPFALAVVGVTLSVLMMVLPSKKAGAKIPFYRAFQGLDWFRVGLLVGIMILYGITLKFLGFVISSIIFLILGFLILGERRIWMLLVGSIPLVLFIWLLMSRVLGMYIAPGEIFYMLGLR